MSADTPGEVRSNDGLGLEQWMPLAEAKRLAALWTTGCDLDNAPQWRAVMRVLLDENKRLCTALAKANDQAERFERGWYLRGDALEVAVRQNEHDMLMTGEELRACRAALES